MLTKAMLAAEKAYRAASKPEDLCLAMAHGKDVVPGTCRFLPSLAWTQRGAVVLAGFLLRLQEDKMVGTLAWTMPWTETNALHIATLIDRLGWDGRLFPHDADSEKPGEEGWPVDEEEVRGLRYMMAGRKIQATLTFPPQAEGNRILTIDILRRADVEFAMSPNVGGEIGTGRAELHAYLAELVGRSYVFLGDRA